VSWNLLGLLVLTFILFPLVSYKIFASIIGNDKKTPIPVASSQVTPLVYYMAQTLQAGYTITPTPTQTATATKTLIPTVEVTYVYERPTPILHTFKLSFYDPNIGNYFPDKAQVNCLEWDQLTKKCNSKLLGGTDTYANWYGRGLACPPQLPFYTTLEVYNPPQLKGTWYCVDRGGLIVNDWLDFLLRYPDQVWTGYDLDRFPWGSTVEAIVTLPD